MRLVESHCAAELREQAAAWQAAESLRRYCDATDVAFGDRPETEEWLAWARAYISHLDPLTDAPAMPKPPAATPEALQQHLPEGWSALRPGYSPARPPSRFGT